jgi:hypothetical protein
MRAKNTDASLASVDRVVIRVYWVIQERFEDVPTAWRECGSHKQPRELQHDKHHAVKTLDKLRKDQPDGTLEYRIVRREVKDEPTGY